MGKEELLDALAELQTMESIEGTRTQFVVVHEALSDIQRNRWKFLEDACSVVQRRVFGLVSSDDDDTFVDLNRQKFTISTQEGVNLCLEFVEPLIHSTLSIADVLDDVQEAASQRGVLVAALLHLLAKVPVNRELKSRLVADILLCGVATHVILATLRFREELIECRRALIPSYESDSEAESELNSDDDEGMPEEAEFESDDTQWITEQMAKAWGLTTYRYFLQTSIQEYSFSAWSYRGIGNFLHAMLTNEQHGVKSLTAVVSPFSWLFHIAAYSHYMIHSEDHQERLRGLELLRVASAVCLQGKLTLDAELKRDANNDIPQTFREQAASIRKRDWVSPLIQVITNAMVSFPKTNDRSSALAVLKELVSRIAVTDRFWILRDLILKCPYGNVAAVLVDFVRSDVVQTWFSLETTPQSPFKTSSICVLLQDTLAQAAERDLVLHADLIASCLSLLRYLYIRDKDNKTGVRTKTDCGVWEVLTRISKRLQLKIEESTSEHSTAGSQPVENDFTHLMILEASIGSTLELCK